MNAASLIAALNMQPHPEGGHYVETYRETNDGRAHVTAIYFVLQAGERSHWHRVDATEIWLWHARAPLTLGIARAGEAQQLHQLGRNIAAGEHPQVVVPPHAWQSAQSTGEWTLVSCIVAPGFDFAGFDLAPPNWSPG